MKITQLDGLYFKLSKKNLTAKVIESPDIEGDIIIPRTIFYESQEYIVTSIASNFFKGNQNVKSLSFEQDSEIRLISKYAFSGSSIEKIDIPPKLETLEEGWCFGTPKLVHITISDNNSHFFYIDKSHEMIGFKNTIDGQISIEIVFASRSIQRATIPSNVARIKPYAFSHCVLLESVEFERASNLSYIDEGAFYQSSLASISIPNRVSQISKCAFFYCASLVKVEFAPDSLLEAIGHSAFCGTSLECVAIPRGVVEIGESAFMKCARIQKVEFLKKSELEVIDKSAFLGASLEAIVVPSKVKTIGNRCFCDSKLRSIEFEADSELSILGDEAFQSTPIEKVHLPQCLCQIGRSTFSMCADLSEVHFAENCQLKTIGECAFSSTRLSSIQLPKSVTSLGQQCFYECRHLEELLVDPDGLLESIGAECFSFSCIENIVFPKNLVFLEDGWCSGTTKLAHISIPDDNNRFVYIDTDVVGFKDDEKTVSIVFAGRSIKSCKVPKEVVSIKPYAFANCNGLERFEFTNDSQLTVISKGAFTFSSLPFISVPSGVSEIGECAFYGCKLKRIEFGHNSLLKAIEKMAFSMSEIECVSFPTHLRKIGEQSFSGCQKIRNFSFAPNIELAEIEKYAFFNSSLECAAIPENFKNVGQLAFSKCRRLTCVEALGNDVVIEEKCFSMCGELRVAAFPNAAKVKIEGGSFAAVADDFSLFVCAGVYVSI